MNSGGPRLPGPEAKGLVVLLQHHLREVSAFLADAGGELSAQGLGHDVGREELPQAYHDACIGCGVGCGAVFFTFGGFETETRPFRGNTKRKQLPWALTNPFPDWFSNWVFRLCLLQGNQINGEERASLFWVVKF